jgi:DNA polymerase-3 subunit gamma/tau
MTLLRMLAFQPSTDLAIQARPAVSMPAIPAAAPKSAAAVAQQPAASAELRALPSVALSPDQWPGLSRRLSVTGLARQFVQQAELVSCSDQPGHVGCRFRVPIRQLTETAVTVKVQDALAQHFGKPFKIEAQVGETAGRSAAAEDAVSAAKLQATAEQSIETDPLVQTLLHDFGGKIVPGSVKASQVKKDAVSNRKTGVDS